MKPEEPKAITDLDRPDPAPLDPHTGLAARDAHAHVWPGLKVVFGDEWRERAAPACVHAFLAWIDTNPNADYGAYDGLRDELSPAERGLVF